MRTRSVILGFVLLGATVSSAWAAELPTVEQLLAKMAAKMAEVRSCDYDLKSVGDWSSLTWTSGSHWAVEISEENGKSVVKVSARQKIVKKGVDGKEVTWEGRTACDGNVTWHEARSSDQEGIRVQKVRPIESDFLARNVSSLKRDAEYVGMKVVGEDTIDGQKMYVLEGLNDHPPDTGITSVSIKVWVGQDDLWEHRKVRSFLVGKADRPNVTTTDLVNLKVNQKIDPELFKYTPPEGALVEDQTKK